jgi:two-component sensor histidine kinase
VASEIAPPTAETPSSLALAVIASSVAPLLLLDGDLTVIAASLSFCRAFQIRPADARGRRLSELGDGEWATPQLRSLLNASISGVVEIDAYEMDLKLAAQDTRSLVLNAQRLDYGDPEQVRVLLTVSDVTDARAAARLKDDLVRQKAALLQEMQHRIANSLQIIASVLLQSTRRGAGDGAGRRLHDPHDRVMSVAAFKHELEASATPDVELRPYFTRLCRSIGASMIRDHDHLSLEVTADDSFASPDVSVSLGLIITELLINALKHGFPNGRGGKIIVDYRSHGPGWTLSVGDDGVGMPAGQESAKPGLGTSIVEALARHLNARIEVAKTNPGTSVSIVCAAASRGDRG